MRIGDRYTTDTYSGGFRNEYEVVDLSTADYVVLRYLWSTTTFLISRHNVESLTYLGNFNKSDNLTTLFDILSENRHPTSTLENGTNIANL